MEFETFEGIQDDPHPFPRNMPWGGYNFALNTLAVIASDDSGNYVILWEVGPHIRLELEETGLSLETLDLDPEDQGIWVWDGRGVWYPGPYEYPQDGDMVLEGTFRPPTDEEWAAIHRNECPWNDDDWLAPRFKDLVLAYRGAPKPASDT
jgi:hypothetical protein